MKKRIFGVMAIFICLLPGLLTGCTRPATALTAMGELGRINLTWAAQDTAMGYHVYRRAGETGDYVRLTETPLVETAYSESVPSPEGDGVFYYYYVTAVGQSGNESRPSRTVRSMHGTRLWGIYSVLLLEDVGSPYVVDPGKTLRIAGASLTIGSGASLILLEGSTVEIRAGGTDEAFINILGKLQALGTSKAPVTITAYEPEGGALVPGQGFGLSLSGTDSSLIRCTRITNLNGNGITIRECSPVIEECRIGANADPRSTIRIIGGGPTVRYCEFDQVELNLIGLSQESASLKIEYNRFTRVYYCLKLSDFASSTLQFGQIANNAFLGLTGAVIGLSGITGTSMIPLGGNHWGYYFYPWVEGGFRESVDFDPVVFIVKFRIGPSWK